MPTQPKDQQHPQYKDDRATLDTILAAEPTDYTLAELARLLIRYRGFPGARDIHTGLKQALQRWQLTESTLYTKTREIHAQAQVYKGRGAKRDDWS